MLAVDSVRSRGRSKYDHPKPAMRTLLRPRPLSSWSFRTIIRPQGMPEVYSYVVVTVLEIETRFGFLGSLSRLRTGDKARDVFHLLALRPNLTPRPALLPLAAGRARMTGCRQLGVGLLLVSFSRAFLPPPSVLEPARRSLQVLRAEGGWAAFPDSRQRIAKLRSNFHRLSANPRDEAFRCRSKPPYSSLWQTLSPHRLPRSSRDLARLRNLPLPSRRARGSKR
jgi:hypothetical protein